MTILVVVPGERHVERLARDGIRAETRTALRTRLASAFLPDVRFADPRETRLALAMALLPLATKSRASSSRTKAPQLDLFAATTQATTTSATTANADTEAAGDPVLGPLRRRGGASWVRLVESIDTAIGIVRARGGTAEDLERTATKAGGVTASRARTLADAMRALDEALRAAGATDSRLLGRALADAIAAAEPPSVAASLGVSQVRARWLLAWDPSDLAWWRALDDRLSRLSRGDARRDGWARIAIPSFDRPLEGARERDPLEVVADDVAKGLDGAPEAELIPMVLGDLAGTAPAEDASADRLLVVRAQDPVAQAQRVAAVVHDALAGGARVERIAVAAPSLDERTLGPLRRALEDRSIVAYEARGAPPSEAPVVVAALSALEAATSLERRLVSRLLRSGFVDAGRIAGEDAPRRDAARALERVAHALEANATARGADPAERLVATARLGSDDDREDAVPLESFARSVVDILALASAPKTRGDHLRAAREIWQRLGIGARAGRGGLAAFARDEPPIGVPRAERLAIARDARAWESLVSAVDAYENVAHATKSLEQTIDGEAFRLELAGVLDAAAARPGAGRAGAVRIARLADVAGDDLDLLVVIDANEGVLPRDVTQDAIVSDALGEALARASRGTFAPLGGTVARARDLAALATAAGDAARVVLAYTVEDGAGAPLAPSPIVDVLLRAGAPLDASPASAVPSAVASAVASVDDIALRAARERAREAFFLDPARPLSDLTADLAAPDPRIAELLARETGGAERALAVTGLERFAKCPFMGFAHVVLAARDAERGEELPDAREEGNLVHEALAAAFSATAAEWPRRPRASANIVESGLAAAEIVLERAAGHAVLATVVRLRVRDAVRATLLRAIDDDTWDFAAAEQKFGARDPSSWPAFVLEGEGTRLTLRGSIDRVDRAHDGAQVRVVDYKRSKSTVRDAASGLGESAMQVPLYACVASAKFRVPAKGMYLATQPRDIAEGSATPTAKVERRMDDLVTREAEGALAEIERRALAVVRSVRGGHLAPTPVDEALCRTCSVSGGCRKPRFAMTPAEDEEEGVP